MKSPTQSCWVDDVLHTAADARRPLLMGLRLTRRKTLRIGLAGAAVAVFDRPAMAEAWISPGADRPAYVRALEASYGAANQKGFGSTVLFGRARSRAELEQMALAAYRHFVGDLWARWGEAAWMGPWRLLYERAGPGNILDDLKALGEPSARSSALMVLDPMPSPEAARAALAAAFDDPAVRELLIFNLGDGGAMSGLLIAARRDTGEAVFLVFLMD